MTLKTLCGFALCFAAGLPLAGCNDTATEGRTLPGRSRPLLEHDWPHPREYTLEPSDFRPPEPGAFEASSGLRAHIVVDPSDTLVRVTASIPVGRFFERDGESGASEALTRAITSDSRGTPPLSLRLESLGADLETDLGVDGLTLGFEVLSEDWEEALDLMIDVLRSSRPSRSSELRTGPGFVSPTATVSGPGFRPQIELERRLGGYPLSPAEPGRTVSPGAVESLARRSLAPNLLVLGIGGNVPREEVESRLQQLTSGWERSAEAAEVRPLESRDGSGKLVTIDEATLEGWVAIGRGIGPVPEEERAPLAVLAEVLGTRLNIAVREVRGLANRAAFFAPETANGAGLLHVRTGGRLEAVAPLIKYCRDEMASLQSGETAVSDEELELAKGILRLGDFQEALDGARRAAASYARATMHRGSPADLLAWADEIQAVSSADVQNVAAKYLDVERMDTIVIGPIERIREARHPRWPVDLDALSDGGS